LVWQLTSDYTVNKKAPMKATLCRNLRPGRLRCAKGVGDMLV